MGLAKRETYISMLRGINVSGHNLIKMELLKNMYAGLGFENVRSFIQSGNVVFQSGKTNPKSLEEKITNKILSEFNMEVPVLVKTAEELSAIIHGNPFRNRKAADLEKLHVTFLSRLPETILAEKLKDLHFLPDEYHISTDAIYLFCPNGYGQTKLNNNFFENKLKVRATTRNWKTVNVLSEMAAEIPVNRK